MSEDGKYPVSDKFKVLEGWDILRTENLIVAIVAVESEKGRDVRLYRWHKKDDQWKVDLCRMSMVNWNFTDIYNKVQELKKKFEIKLT